MKTLNRYIIEKFQITKDSKIMYYPKDRAQLRKILIERLAEDKNADLNDIDVSAIDDMGDIFYKLDPHNIKIDKWNVSNVKYMRDMFYGCENFNCNLGNWDVSNVEDMRDMFYRCNKFKGEELENWKPKKCKDLYDIFYGCSLLKNKPSWYKG